MASLGAFRSLCNVSSRFALSAATCSARMAASRSTCRARSASRTFPLAFFNLTNILDSTRYSSRPPFRERRISAALAEFLESFWACATASQRSTKSGFLKISTPSIPSWQAYAVSQITRAPADNGRFHKNISVNAMPSAGTLPRPSATSPPIPPATPPPPRFAVIEPTTAATTSAISTQ